MAQLIVTTLTLTGVLGRAVLASAATTSTQSLLFTANFDHADAPGFEVHDRILSSGQGSGRLTPSGPGRAVARAKARQIADWKLRYAIPAGWIAKPIRWTSGPRWTRPCT